MVSIALATYNGELYISELLESIANQTKLPDELVISDDSSTDSTLEIVNEFAQRMAFPVKVSINKERLGSTRNFEGAIRTCSGDIIFPCDQDDIWYKNKIERIIECFANNPETGAVFSDADVVDQNLNLLKGSLWKRLGITRQELANINTHKGAFKVIINRNMVTGTVMAFRAKYRENIVPIPKEWTHDYWIALIISTSSTLTPLPMPLIAYRQHAHNQIGAPETILKKISNGGKNKGKSFHTIYSSKAKAYRNILDYLMESSVSNTVEGKNKMSLVKDRISFYNARLSLPNSHWKRLPIIWKEFISFRYQRYKSSRHAIKDLIHKVD
jgi:glycosyltransferase involved in cell wall biosynthesis